MGRWPEWRRERVWELWVEGYSLHAIAREVGMARDNVTACVAASGGVRPAPRKRAERCLWLGEREEVSRGLACGESFRAIGRAIGRPHTTVARRSTATAVVGATARSALRGRRGSVRVARSCRSSRSTRVCAGSSRRNFSESGRRSRSRGGCVGPTRMILPCGSRTRDLSVAVRPVAWGAAARAVQAVAQR